MNSRERVLSSLARTGHDRIPVKHEGTPEVNQMLMQYFGLSNHEQLLRALGDDFRYIQPVYCGPELRTFPDGSFEGLWGERYGNKEYPGGSYAEAVYLPYAGIHKAADLDRSHFPQMDWFDFSTIKSQCKSLHNEYALCFGSAGDLDFMNTIGRMRGLQQVYEDLLTEDPAFMELFNARFRFYDDLHRHVLDAADGMIDIIHVGEDLGNQNGPMIALETFDRLFAPKYKAIFDLAHQYGAKTMMHMCGCVVDFLPALIDLGLDIQDVVQPTTPRMDIAYLQNHFGDRLNFCGSMCVQTILPFGTETEVIHEVERRIELFPKGGLFLGPTHAIQVGTPVANILAMYRRAGSLAPKIDDAILNVGVEESANNFDLFKLF